MNKKIAGKRAVMQGWIDSWFKRHFAVSIAIWGIVITEGASRWRSLEECLNELLLKTVLGKISG
jgi:hypothetical protein